jgi:hypothetical protein
MLTCPIGLTKNMSLMKCTGSSTAFIHYKFQSLLDTIPDEQGRFPATVDPTLRPVPVYKRGYYFDSSLATIGQELGTVHLEMSNILTLELWVSPRGMKGESFIFAIAQDTDVKWGLSLAANSFNFVFEGTVVLSSPFVTYVPDYPSTWYFTFCYLKSLSSTVAEAGLFTSMTGLTKISVPYEFELLSSSSYAYSIGGRLTNDYYKGFVYDFKLYSYYEPSSATHFSTSCSGCLECQTSSCIPTCEFNEWLDGSVCVPCTDSSWSCLDNQDASLCVVDYCSKCSTFEGKCSTCEATYAVASSGACECPSTLLAVEGLCIKCTENCVKCSLTTCLQCASLYYKGTDDQCYPCIQDCLECTSQTTCSRCKAGMELDSGVCQVKKEAPINEQPSTPPPETVEPETPTEPKGEEGTKGTEQPTQPESSPDSGPSGGGTEYPDCSALCEICSASGCVKCKANTLLYDVCTCSPTYVEEEATCRGVVELASDTQLKLSFPRELSKPLGGSDITLTVDNSAVAVSFEISLALSNRFYYLSLDLGTADAGSYSFTLKFTAPLYDINNTQFSTSPLSFVSYWSKPKEVSQAQQATSESTAAQEVSLATTNSVSGVSIATSILTSDIALLFTLLNSFQMLAYIPLLQVDLPPRVLGTLSGINLLDAVPNPLESSFSSSDEGEKPFKKAYEYGFKTTNFIVNIGQEVTVVVFFAGMLVVFLIGSKLTWFEMLQKYCRACMQDYRYNVILSTWTGLYFDIAISAAIQADSPSYSSSSAFAATILAYVMIGMLALAPVVLIVGTLHSYNRLMSDTALYSRWSALYDDYKPTKASMVQLSWFFTLRSLTVVITVGMRNPDLQMVLCCLLMFAVSPMQNVLIDALMQPYWHHQDLFLNITAKVMMLLVYSAITCYHFKVPIITEDVLMFLIYVAIGTIGCFSMLFALIKIAVLLRDLYRRAMRRAPVSPRATTSQEVSYGGAEEEKTEVDRSTIYL